jgi:hypothetical protein
MYIVQIHKYYISKTYYMYNISYIDINNTNYTILIHDTYIYIIVNLYHLLYPTFGGPKLKTTRNGTVTTNISHSHRLQRWSPPLGFDKSQLSTGFHPLGDQMGLLVAGTSGASIFGRSA